MIKVLIADDHRMVADGVSRLLERDARVHVAGIACTLEETARMMGTLCPHVLLLDVAMPDGDGIDAIPNLLSLNPETKIVVLTMFTEPSVIRRALEAQAHGYLMKTASSEELVAAVHSVMAGETYLCEEVRNRLNERLEVAPTLTLREREILRLLSEGNTMKEVADRLCLSFETVHSYSKNLRAKLGCNNVASLVKAAMEQHWI